MSLKQIQASYLTGPYFKDIYKINYLTLIRYMPGGNFGRKMYIFGLCCSTLLVKEENEKAVLCIVEDMVDNILEM